MKVSAIVVAGLLSFRSVRPPRRHRRPDRVNRRDGESGRHRCGKLAESRATNAEVKAFAQLMITDHTGVNKAATDLVPSSR